MYFSATVDSARRSSASRRQTMVWWENKLFCSYINVSKSRKL